MNRLEEVEVNIHLFSKWLHDAGTIDAFERRHADLARTLAAEVDTRDEVIMKLLAEIESVKGRYFGSLEAYDRACEIAGREE